MNDQTNKPAPAVRDAAQALTDHLWKTQLAGIPFHLVADLKQALDAQAPAVAPDDFAAHTVLSGTARHKVADLIASGYRICGYTMERPGHRSAVVFDAAVRWLDDFQRHTLMFVEGARVVGRPATDEQMRDSFGAWSCRMADAAWLVQSPLERFERTYREAFRDGERAHGIVSHVPVQPTA